jgi:phage repressor protein C with HTH and peptisase S24 domain/DNA-binding XRE family transcriptional regulator
MEKMQTQPKQRLKLAREALNLSYRELATPLGRSYQAVSDWEKGKAPISPIIADALEKYHGISAKWLLNGDGEMLTRKLDTISTSGVDVIVPFLPVQAAAGEGNTLSDYVNVVKGMRFDALWLRRAFGVPPDNLCIVEVDGDSMMPTLQPNEFVFVDGLREIPEFRDGVWVLRTRGKLFVKRIHQLGYNYYEITSDNPAYGSLEPDESTQLLGRVVGGLPKRY